MRRRAFLAAGVAALGLGTAFGAAADPPVQPVRVGEPPPGKGRIVFFRRWYYAGGADTYRVREGDAGLGDLPNANYFVVDATPGWHTYTVKAEKHDYMQIEIEAGETYYVVLELGTGLLLYQPTLTPTEQRAFDEVSAKLRMSQPGPP